MVRGRCSSSPCGPLCVAHSHSQSTSSGERDEGRVGATNSRSGVRPGHTDDEPGLRTLPGTQSVLVQQSRSLPVVQRRTKQLVLSDRLSVGFPRWARAAAGHLRAVENAA